MFVPRRVGNQCVYIKTHTGSHVQYGVEWGGSQVVPEVVPVLGVVPAGSRVLWEPVPVGLKAVDNLVGAGLLACLDGFGEGGSAHEFEASGFGFLDDVVEGCVFGESVFVESCRPFQFERRVALWLGFEADAGGVAQVIHDEVDLGWCPADAAVGADEAEAV